MNPKPTPSIDPSPINPTDASNPTTNQTPNEQVNRPEHPEMRVKCRVRTRIPTRAMGTYACHLYTNSLDDTQHLALVFGDIHSRSLDPPTASDPTDILSPIARSNAMNGSTAGSSCMNGGGSRLESVLVRVHSSCFTGETVFSSRCDCADQLEDAMYQIAKEGRGVIVYLFQEGRGIGLLDKLKAYSSTPHTNPSYNLQDQGHDTIQANILLNHHPDPRTYHAAIHILNDLNITSIRLLTNNPGKIDAISGGGIEVRERVRILPRHWDEERIRGIGREKVDGLDADADVNSGSATNVNSGSAANGTKTHVNINGHAKMNGHVKNGSLQGDSIHSELDNYVLTKIRRMNHIV